MNNGQAPQVKAQAEASETEVTGVKRKRDEDEVGARGPEQGQEEIPTVCCVQCWMFECWVG